MTTPMTLHRAVVLAAFALSSCTTEKITYITREPFNSPADAIAGFLGYFTVTTKQTTCGNCHVGHQADWVTTKHADAWADLQGSGHASASCSVCHTVSEKGNSTGHAAGYSVVQNAAYHDVQCESCHGAGNTHVQNPEVIANRPLASMHVDTGLANGCGGCHTGIHSPFVDQWVQSGHGSGPGYASAAANASCAPCHEGKAALRTKFGVTTNYVELGDTTHQRIVCAVCHDPHGTAGFEGQLRASMSTPTMDNLCIKCHSRTGSPPWPVATTSASRGPHGAQGLLVIGQNVGWIPPNFTYDTSLIVSSHGTAGNPRLCATCHVTFTTVTDRATGAFQLQNVGHLFEAIPCTDVNGIPVPGTCAQAQRDFSGCVSSGCHPSRASAVSSYNANVATINNLLDQIWLDVNTNGIIDSTPDTGLMPQLVARSMRPGATRADSLPLRFDTTVTTVAKGTLFNAALAATDSRAYFLAGRVYGKSWAAHASSGNGVHNPFLLQALLTASIAAVHSTYSLAPPPNLDLRIRATPPPGLRVSVR